MDGGLKIYRSSAGSGKTYTLVKEYLKLVLESPSCYKEILAVTFTNKAAAEMKTRIISALDRLARNDYPDLQQVLEKELNMPRLNVAQQAGHVLTFLLHDYSNFSVSTIDSFFQRLIRGFSKELHLPMNFGVELEQKMVLEESVERLLEEIDDNRQLQQWLTDFTLGKLEEGKSWQIRKDLVDFGQEMFKESFADVVEDDENDVQEGLFKQEAKIPKLKYELILIRKRFEDEMDMLGKEACQLMTTFNIEDHEFFRGQVSGLFRKIQKDGAKVKSKQFEIGKTIRATLDGGAWYKKDAEAADRIDAAREAGLEDLLVKTVGLCDAEFPKYKSAQLVLNQIHMLGLVQELSKKIAEYREENEVLLISDITKMLRSLTAETDTPFVFEKIGTWFKHLMIDEVQDTSDYQWHNFKPLVENALSEGNSVLVVGDVKQSIYRWRNGNLDLLQNRISAELAHFNQFPTPPLNQNWRSLPNVVKFNNALFQSAFEHLKSVPGLMGDALFEGVYADVKQEVQTQKPGKGYVEVTFLNSDLKESEDPKNWKQKSMERLPSMIENAKEQGYRPNDIAILVRKNKEGREVADFLSGHVNAYKIVSGEALKLGSSNKVKFIILVLKYLQNPLDSVARTEVLHARLNLMNATKSMHERVVAAVGGSEEFEAMLPELADENKNQLSGLTLYELTDQLLKDFGLLFEPDIFILRFQDLVLQFEEKQGQSIPAFLNFWDERGQDKNVESPTDPDAIRVTSIHKSKGLEFPIVIVPFADWSLVPVKPPTILWAESDVKPFSDIQRLPVHFQKPKEDSVFEEDFQKETVLSALDNFNLLYVALTRAEQKLFVHTEWKGKFEKGISEPADISDLLYQSLTGLSQTSEPTIELQKDGFRFSIGEEPERNMVETEETDPALGLSKMVSNPWREKVKVRQSSEGFSSMSNKDGQRTALAWGSLVHAALEHIETLDDLDSAITTLKFSGLLIESEVAHLKTKLLEVFELEEVKPWFQPKWTVLAEREILLPDGTNYRPDRVIVKDNEAVVVDYKTGEPRNKDRKQVQLYGEILKSMGYEVLGCYLLYISELKVEQVV